MSKSLPLEAVKTMLKPVMHLIGKKADKEDVPDVSGFIKSVNGTTADENGNVDVTGLPDGASAYQQLVTDGEGNTKWEDRINCIPEPSIVAVGQTVVVKTVDENGKPTEWEAANAVKSWNDLEDKPFYDDGTIETLVGTVQTEWERAGRPGSNLFTESGELADSLEAGKSYRIVGTVTRYGADIPVDAVFVRNSDGDSANYIPLEYDGNIFYVGYEGMSVMVYDDIGMPTSAAGAMDISVYLYESNILQLPEKYIPDTIARTENIPECEIKKPYTLTETITLAEAINSKTLTFTEDADSYQLAFSCPAAEAALGLSAEVYTADGLVAYMWMAGMIDTTAKYAKCSMYRAHGEWVFESMQPVNNENQTSAVSRNPKFVSAEKPITKIVVYASGGGMMPAGTTIEVRTF